MRRRTVLAGSLATALAPPLAATRARAQPRPLRVGILNDMSGVFADYQGPGSVVAARLAVEDWAAAHPGAAVAVLSADHQNKPDVGLAIARRWLDQEGVDAIMDVPNSAIALAVADLVRDRNRVFIGSGAGIADLTGAKCSPNTVHWTYDTWEITHALGRAITERGGKTWFTVAADYSFGADLDRNIREAVGAAGGQVLGGVKHPFPTDDFSSFLLTAQASGAQVLALNNAGGDTTTALKQAAEFGLTRTMQICGPVFNINMAQGVGLRVAQGVLGVSPFYWDMDDGARAFSRRFAERHSRHAMPNDMQAGVYAGLLHLLKAAVQAGASGDGRAVVAAMKAIPTDDPLFGRGSIRADGRKLHPVHLIQAKTPAESTGEWDLFKVIGTIPADQAFRPLPEGGCALVKA
jgi:branched-chain amino acid transport system substrate-binding protein